jgi:hypothetical protein
VLWSSCNHFLGGLGPEIDIDEQLKTEIVVIAGIERRTFAFEPF